VAAGESAADAAVEGSMPLAARYGTLDAAGGVGPSSCRGRLGLR
jgi:hypothetical protein